MNYYTQSNQAISKLEKKLTSVFSVKSVLTSTQALTAYHSAREKMLDAQNSFRFVETQEQKDELWNRLKALNNQSLEMQESYSDCKSYAFAMAALRIQKEAQIKANIKNWQAI